MPDSPRLVAFALAQPLLLLVAWLLGRGVHALLRSRARLSAPTLTVASMLGMSLGIGTVGWWRRDLELWSPLTVLAAALGCLAVLAVLSAVVLSAAPDARPPTIREQAGQGESDRLELKSSARVNMRTGQRDERMELVVCKTIAAFENSRGGTLLLGVDDDGTLLGLAADFATLKTPDCDRFELWLRDTLHTRLGANPAALPVVDFEPLDDGSHVARVRVPESPRPVYLRTGKGASATPELWVRVGNSTRSLAVDDAAQYVAERWPVPVATAVRHHMRGAGRRLVGR